MISLLWRHGGHHFIPYTFHLRSALNSSLCRQALMDSYTKSLYGKICALENKWSALLSFNTATVREHNTYTHLVIKCILRGGGRVLQPFTFFPLIVLCAIKKRTGQGPPIGSAYLPLKASLNFMFTSGSPSPAVFLPLVSAHKKVLRL